MSLALAILLDGVSYGMILFIISVGLTITMGLMRVVNLAHGAFAMVGGYVAAVLTGAGVPFIFAVAAAAATAGLCGAVAERTIYRPIYNRTELDQVLMTIGLAFVSIAALTLLFGTNLKTVQLPASLDHSVDIGFRLYPAYRLFVIAVGLALASSLWLLMDRSLFGARLRAAVDDQRMARAVGINVDRLFTITFIGGCALAGFGGAIGATMLPPEPFYALKYLVLFLIIVAVGGHGSFKGSFVAAIALGLIDTTGKYVFPESAAFLLYVAVFALLLWRPDGILPPKSVG